MSQYLGAHLLLLLPLTEDGRIDWRNLLSFGALGAVWNYTLAAYLAVAATVPLTIVLSLWCADMVLGTLASACCGFDGQTGWGALRASKAQKGIAKLLVWCCALFVAFSLRKAGVLGGGLFAGIVESYVVFAEVGSVLKNLGRLAGLSAIERLGELAENKGHSLTMKGNLK